MPEPTSSLRRRRQLRLTPRGVTTLAVGVLCVGLAYPTARHELLVVGCVAIALVLLALAMVQLRRARLTITRLFSPPVVTAGSVAHVTVRVGNTGWIATPTLLCNDAIPWREPQHPHELAPVMPGRAVGNQAQLDYVLHPPRRGLYPIGPLVVESSDPFGMVRGGTACGDADRLTVVPAVADLPGGGPLLIDGDGAAQLVQRRAVGNDDDLTTREYRTGDAMRRVHWRASARHGELMVRREEHRSHPDARIVIDTRLSGFPDAVPDTESWPPAPASDAFEWAVHMLASLTVHLENAGFRVEVIESAPRQVEPVSEHGESNRRLEGFLTSLASLRLDDHNGELPAIDADAAGPMFTLLAEPDADVVDWVLRQRRPGQAAAVFALGMPQTVRERFTDAGWVCVDADPADDVADAWRLSATEAGYLRGAD